MSDYELWRSRYIYRRYIHLFCRFFADWRLREIMILGFLLALTGCSGPAPHRVDGGGQYSLAPQHRQEVVMTAMGLIGSPYRGGGRDPARGFDCSGLVSYVFEQAAQARLPRTAASQAAATRRVARRELREGDLVFFNTLGRPNSHVGIYIGDGRFVNAPSSGGRVRIDRMDNPYFAKRFDSAGTLFAGR